MTGIDKSANDLQATGGLPRVTLIWIDKERQYWIRFGHPDSDRILDRQRREVGFKPRAMFALVRWAPDGLQAAARAKGRERFEGFVQALGRRLSKGASFSREVTIGLEVAGDIEDQANA